MLVFMMVPEVLPDVLPLILQALVEVFEEVFQSNSGVLWVIIVIFLRDLAFRKDHSANSFQTGGHKGAFDYQCDS